MEIDRLEWSAFRWNENVIRIELTRYLALKSKHSKGDILMDEKVMSIFHGHFAKARSNFVIEGLDLSPERAMFEGYRAEKAFDCLSAWLQKHGVTDRKPIHTLRKEFGSQVLCKTRYLRCQPRSTPRQYHDHGELLPRPTETKRPADSVPF